MQKPFKGPMLLCILDGFGENEEVAGNAIKAANTPCLDEIYKNHPHAQLLTHGEHVGLPKSQMGNSEVGHMTIGSGRIILQSLDKISKDLTSGEFERKLSWQEVIKKSENSRAIHLIGMVSDGGVHSHTNHLIGLCKILDKLNKPIFIHVITDGRDTAPFDAVNQLKTFTIAIKSLNNIHIADVAGRFYAMDRDNRSERTTAALDLYLGKTKPTANNITEAISSELENNDYDEYFIKPTKLNLTNELNSNIENNDSLIFFNFRADRMRQITQNFIENEINLNVIATMTEYNSEFNNDVTVIYPPEVPQNTLGEIVANNGGKQLRIAESEKYAHVTFFLNGGREEPFKNEDRIVIPSPKVRSYDVCPEMSLPEVTSKLLEAIKNGNYDLIVLNIANGDQVGHSGNFEASKQTVEHIDKALNQIVPAIKENNGEMLIIADHGNCDEMLDKNGNISTSHSTNPVPIIYIGRKGATISSGGLADVTPTILSLMEQPIPPQATGKNLIKL